MSRAQLESRGTSSRQIARHVERGRLQQLDHGWYVDGETWREWSIERRHLARVVAARRRQTSTDAVFSHCSAAVLWALPLARVDPRKVHVSGAGTNGHVMSSSSALARHQVEVAGADRAAVDGIPCTGIHRTVADVIRTSPMETGLSLLDAALRRVAWDEVAHRYDEDAAAEFCAGVAARLPAGARGVRRARAVLSLGDGRAQLPGESISRLYLSQLGFAAPRLQVPVDGPRGRVYYVDFGLDDVDAWGEFDGRDKYLDPGLRRGVDLDETLLAEKAREDWIRGTTGRRLVRWEGRHISSAAVLGEHLAAFHLRPPSVLRVGSASPW